MRIVSLPKSYLALVGLIALSTPLFFLNGWVLHRDNSLKFTLHEGVVWLSLQLLWALVTARWLLQVRRRGLWSVILFGMTMLAVNLSLLVATKNYAIAFYALFLVIVTALYALNLYRVMAAPYYRSGRVWYEGRPRYLPKLEGELLFGGQPQAARLSRLGAEGCFAYVPSDLADAKSSPTAISLKMGDFNLNCAVELISREQAIGGWGLRFRAESPDQRKEIHEFIDRVRSVGYVS